MDVGQIRKPCGIKPSCCELQAVGSVIARDPIPPKSGGRVPGSGMRSTWVLHEERFPSLPRTHRPSHRPIDPGHLRGRPSLTFEAAQVYLPHTISQCTGSSVTRERKVTLKQVARRSTVYEIGLELITRRSVVRIHLPLPERHLRGCLFVSEGYLVGLEPITCRLLARIGFHGLMVCGIRDMIDGHSPSRSHESFTVAPVISATRSKNSCLISVLIDQLVGGV